MKKTQKKNSFFPLPPAPSPGYPQDPDPDPDPDPHEDFCPDPDPDPQKKCGSETLALINTFISIIDLFLCSLTCYIGNNDVICERGERDGENVVQ